MSLDVMKQALAALNDCTYDEEAYCLNPDNVDAILALRAAIEQAERPQTHSEECWRWHHQCAIAKIERGNK